MPEPPQPSDDDWMPTIRLRVPMRETAADRAVKDATYSAAGDEIRQFIERYEAVEQERRELGDDLKLIMAEAKSRGFDTKTLRRIIAMRKRSADELAEEQAILETYLTALGMT